MTSFPRTLRSKPQRQPCAILQLSPALNAFNYRLLRSSDMFVITVHIPSVRHGSSKQRPALVTLCVSPAFILAHIKQGVVDNLLICHRKHIKRSPVVNGTLTVHTVVNRFDTRVHTYPSMVVVSVDLPQAFNMA